MKLSPCA